jgi:hypothetical protein
MNRYILKFALLALVAVGMLSIAGCKKGEEEPEPSTTRKPLTQNPFVGTWVCTDELYTESGTLQLIFDDNTVIGTNTTNVPSAFDTLNATYEYRDGYLYFDGVRTLDVTIRSDNYLSVFCCEGMPDASGNSPEGNWSNHFERIGGVK